MTPEEKQAALKRWLPEIAKACGFEECEWIMGTFLVSGKRRHPVIFDPVGTDRDSELVRRVMQIEVEWNKTMYNTVACSTFLTSEAEWYRAEVKHDGTPDSMVEAERWAVLQAAAKKLGLRKMDKTEWLERCSLRYQVYWGFTKEDADKLADASLDNIDYDLTENPEDTADEDMTCWGE